jgi:hypothetical protein
MLKTTLQKIYKMFLSKKKLTMNLNIMPKLYITKKTLYINKRLDNKNDDPQQANIVI